MSTPETIYRRLQEHLNRQAVGFPATASGAELRILKRLFSQDEAQVATFLSFKPSREAHICEKTHPEFTPSQTKTLLESMFQKGAIAWKRVDGIDYWYLAPLVVGMYEFQDGNPDPGLLRDASRYFKTLSFQKAFIAAKPSQMRTIPVDASIPLELPVATYDRIRSLVRESKGPFVLLKCICREASARAKKPCEKTSREETCVAFGTMAAMVLRRNHGREVTREELLETFLESEKEGLVLQPSNTRNPEFVCSCCGCCCGMLAFQKRMPHPIDFWSGNYFAGVFENSCTGCGACVSRCQVGAISFGSSSRIPKVQPTRCIGCGLCVPTCPSGAIRLQKRKDEKAPPADEEALYDEIMSNKKTSWSRITMLLKVFLGMRQ